MINSPFIQQLGIDESRWILAKVSQSSEDLNTLFEQAERDGKEVLLEISPGDSLETDKNVFGKVKLILIRFDDPMDGRGFSQAVILRDIHQFTGELCAANVLEDNIPSLQRCGFTSFLLDSGDFFTSFDTGERPDHVRETIKVAEKLGRELFDSIGSK